MAHSVYSEGKSVDGSKLPVTDPSVWSNFCTAYVCADLGPDIDYPVR